MSTHKSAYITKLEAGEPIHGDVCGGHVRLYRAVVDLAVITVASGDVVQMLKLPNKGQLIAARFGANVTLGTTTVKIGTTDDDVFRAAAVKTDCKPEEMMLPFVECSGQTVVLAAATANAPSSGKVYVDFLVADV
ncbi:MAG: hypothetical protein IJY17_07280 [Alphaproteobacteria bacterium]|nr:hypothetical protein [Alphaproteobacteria bacterium]